jgi:hypothetical protein
MAYPVTSDPNTMYLHQATLVPNKKECVKAMEKEV